MGDFFRIMHAWTNKLGNLKIYDNLMTLLTRFEAKWNSPLDSEILDRSSLILFLSVLPVVVEYFFDALKCLKGRGKGGGAKRK